MTTETLAVDKVIRAIWGASVYSPSKTEWHRGAQDQLHTIVDSVADLLPENERAAFKQAALSDREPRVRHS